MESNIYIQPQKEVAVNVDNLESPLMILLNLSFKDKVRSNHGMIVERSLQTVLNRMTHLKARFEFSFDERETPPYRLGIHRTPRSLYLRWRATGRKGAFTPFDSAISNSGSKAAGLMRAVEAERTQLNEQAQILTSVLNVLEKRIQVT